MVQKTKKIATKGDLARELKKLDKLYRETMLQLKKIKNEGRKMLEIQQKKSDEEKIKAILKSLGK
ncbi:MAG: hypothetical protein WC668_00415 [Patescibacteria group bacterium]|jgi:hypothetical protein